MSAWARSAGGIRSRRIHLQYAVQPSPDGLAQAFVIGDKFIGNAPSVLVLGEIQLSNSGGNS